MSGGCLEMFIHSTTHHQLRCLRNGLEELGNVGSLCSRLIEAGEDGKKSGKEFQYNPIEEEMWEKNLLGSEMWEKN